jgi:hypothetical protein
MLKVVVSNEAGEMFSFSTEKDLMGIYPAAHDKPAVLEALAAATKFLNTNQDVAAAEASLQPEAPPA